jgi:Glucose-6-phosphate dehydrogenase, NAD binding domain
MTEGRTAFSEHQRDPVALFLFGANGDLARRMVLPASYPLACEGLLPPQWLLAGNGRGSSYDLVAAGTWLLGSRPGQVTST